MFYFRSKQPDFSVLRKVAISYARCAEFLCQSFFVVLVFYLQFYAKLSALVDSLEAEIRACVPLRGHHVEGRMYKESAREDFDCQIYLAIAALTKLYKYEKIL